MTGKYIYLAVAVLLGVSAAIIKFFPFLLLVFFYLYGLHKFKRFKTKQLTVLMVMIICFYWIGLTADRNNHSVIPETSTMFTIEYTQDPKIDGDLLQIVAKEKRYNEKLLIRYKIKTQQEQSALKTNSFYGCTCQVSGTLNLPSIAKNPNGFDYRRYLKTKEIYWIIQTDRNPLEHCKPVQKKDPIMILKQLRFEGIRYLEGNFPQEIASLSAALIFGERSMIDPLVLGDYQETGIVHLLAISGLHVSLLIAMVFYLGIRCGLTRQFMTNFLLILLPAYVVLTGGSPSVVRAVLMIFFVLLADKWKERLRLLPIDGISFAFMLCLLINPLLIFDIGFQLSFSVSIAIIVSVQHIFNHYQKVAAMLTVSITAQLAALPFLLYHFFELSLVGIFANLIYIPLFSFIYLPGLYLLFFLHILFGSTPALLIVTYEKIIKLFNKLIAAIANWDFAAFVPGRPNLLLLAAYIILIFAIFFFWETMVVSKRKKLVMILTSCLFIIQPCWNWLSPYGEVTMIDVGQGDSILINLPHRKETYLIDTGGTLSFNTEQWKRRVKPFEVGRDVVVPFLKGKGMTTIDKLILTHGDMDHIGGALAVLQEIKVNEILLPSVAEKSEMEKVITHEAEMQGIPVIFVSEGYHRKGDKTEYYVVAPEKSYAGERNGGSIALVAKIGGLSWFFGGDLDQAGEEKIIKKYRDLNVDVLKAGHHGSKTSSAPSFIQQLSPTIALMSVGENNRFGHPHQEVLDLLKKDKAIIYRTDTQGAITYKFYRGSGTFIPYLP